MTDTPQPISTSLSKLLTSEELADLFQVNIRTVAEWRKKGIPLVGKGKGIRYPLLEVIKWRENNAIAAAVKDTPGGAFVMDEESAKARKLTAEAMEAEIRVAKLRGVLVNVNDSERELQAVVTRLRGLLQSFPARVAPFLLHLPDELSARQAIQNQVRELMEDMARNDLEIEPENADEDSDGN